ncbi:hypothetical protein ACLESO_41245 [Pyxidicoccus sp. 3LG]
MKMNHCVITVLLSLGMTTACVDTPSSIQLQGTSSQNADCTVNDADDVRLLRGALNLAVAPPGRGFPLGINITSNRASTEIEVGGQPISGDEDLNIIYLKELVLGYETVPSLNTPISQPEGPILLHGTLEEDGQLLLNLLTGKAETELRAGVGATPIELLVNIQLRGETASGEEVESNEIIFPLTVGSVAPAACPEGTERAQATDACPQNGYNGVPALPCVEIPEEEPEP